MLGEQRHDFENKSVKSMVEYLQVELDGYLEDFDNAGSDGDHAREIKALSNVEVTARHLSAMIQRRNT